MTRNDNLTTETVTLDAGTYVLGDPCYVVTGENWNHFCDKLRNRGITVANAGHLVAGHTALGDGIFYGDQTGHKYGVDAGLIGAVRVPDGTKQSNSLSHVFVLSEGGSFQLDFNYGNAVFTLKDHDGNVLERISTGGNEFEDEDLEDEDYYDSF